MGHPGAWRSIYSLDLKVRSVHMKTVWSSLLACIRFCVLSMSAAKAGDVVVGVNAWYRPPDMSQEDMIKQLSENGVKTIRTSLMPNTVDFITEAITTASELLPHGMGLRSWEEPPTSRKGREK